MVEGKILQLFGEKGEENSVQEQLDLIESKLQQLAPDREHSSTHEQRTRKQMKMELLRLYHLVDQKSNLHNVHAPLPGLNSTHSGRVRSTHSMKSEDSSDTSIDTIRSEIVVPIGTDDRPKRSTSNAHSNTISHQNNPKLNRNYLDGNYAATSIQSTHLEDANSIPEDIQSVHTASQLSSIDSSHQPVMNLDAIEKSTTPSPHHRASESVGGDKAPIFDDSLAILVGQIKALQSQVERVAGEKVRRKNELESRLTDRHQKLNEMLGQLNSADLETPSVLSSSNDCDVAAIVAASSSLRDHKHSNAVGDYQNLPVRNFELSLRDSESRPESELPRIRLPPSRRFDENVDAVDGLNSGSIHSTIEINRTGVGVSDVISDEIEEEIVIMDSSEPVEHQIIDGTKSLALTNASKPSSSLLHDSAASTFHQPPPPSSPSSADCNQMLLVEQSPTIKTPLKEAIRDLMLENDDFALDKDNLMLRADDVMMGDYADDVFDEDLSDHSTVFDEKSNDIQSNARDTATVVQTQHSEDIGVASDPQHLDQLSIPAATSTPLSDFSISSNGIQSASGIESTVQGSTLQSVHVASVRENENLDEEIEEMLVVVEDSDDVAGAPPILIISADSGNSVALLNERVSANDFSTESDAPIFTIQSVNVIPMNVPLGDLTPEQDHSASIDIGKLSVVIPLSRTTTFQPATASSLTSSVEHNDLTACALIDSCLVESVGREWDAWLNSFILDTCSLFKRQHSHLTHIQRPTKLSMLPFVDSVVDERMATVQTDGRGSFRLIKSHPTSLASPSTVSSRLQLSQLLGDSVDEAVFLHLSKYKTSSRDFMVQKVRETVHKWFLYSEKEGSNLDDMLLDEVRMEEQSWTALISESSLVFDEICDGIWEQVVAQLMDELSQIAPV